MKLFSKKEKKAPAVKQATVEVDAEYYTHLLCKEYLIEAIAKVELEYFVCGGCCMHSSSCGSCEVC